MLPPTPPPPAAAEHSDLADLHAVHRQCIAADGMVGVAVATIGARPHMEDEFLLLLRVDPNSDDVLLCAVFDGHAGGEVSRALRIHFLTFLRHADAWKTGVARPDGPTCEDLQAALHEALTAFDTKLLQSPKLELAGSTANVVLLTPSAVICANVGDSRAVVRMEDATYELSQDHKPNLPHERARIESCGGFVELNRVCGMLAMSRAIGDRVFKETTAAATATAREATTMVIAQPDIQVFPRPADKELVVLLASDGVWDNFATSHDACDALQWCTGFFNDALPPAQEKGTELLVLEAKTAAVVTFVRECRRRAGQAADNITAVVVFVPARKTLSVPETCAMNVLEEGESM